jgi:dethiobiotin synthetase
LFVTGTDTGVGKTRVAAGLCRAFARRGDRVAAMKPVASGCAPTPRGLRNADALALRAAMTVRAPYRDVNPFAFEPAIAPHIVAQDLGVTIDFDVLDQAYRNLAEHADVVIVEGAGGWLVPLDARRCFADLAAFWCLDVILVVGLRLGCLNHALLTAEAVSRRNLCLRGWVGNSVDPEFARAEENIGALRERLAAPCLGVLHFAPGDNADAVGAALHAGVENLS